MPEAEIFRVIIRELNPQPVPDNSKTRITDAIRFFEEAFKSNFFKESVENFGGKATGFNKKYNMGLSNKKIYKKLINAVEVNGNVESLTADLFLNVVMTASPDGRSIGYTENNSKIIHTYNEYILSMSLPALSGHFAHEWTHLLGFKHPIDTGRNAAYLSKTIPYAIEDIVEAYVVQRQVDFMIG